MVLNILVIFATYFISELTNTSYIYKLDSVSQARLDLDIQSVIDMNSLSLKENQKKLELEISKEVTI